MVEIIVNLVLEVVKCLAPRAELQLGYLRNFNANFENLKAEIGKLKNEITSIQDKVLVAERNVEKIDEKVANWLVSASKIIDEAAKFIEDEETTNKRCLKGLCPNLKTRYQLSKKAETEVKVLVEFREEAKTFVRISYPTIAEDICLKSNKGYESFESRVSTLESIRNALTDPNVSIIGVYGMGGVGKTTLVKEVARQAKKDSLFDQVVFLEVSQTIDIKKIQGEIAEKLGLALGEEAESRRAGKLYERLKKEKKMLVVLDNIWTHVDFESVGIPFGDDHKGCKILLTARDRNVLLSLGSETNFSIGALCEEEAWRLFKMMAGDDVEECAFKSTATDVAKACGGLPIALATIARALRSKTVPEWENALHDLRTPSTVNFGGVAAEACSCIELSYKYLKNEQLKKTFLLCSLSGSGLVMDLFKYGTGMGLFQGVHKMEDAHNKLCAWVQELKASCLLLEGSSSESFSIHDVVCDVANSIACRDKNVVLVRNEDVWRWPDDDALKKCNQVFLDGIGIHELPEALDCPQLEFFYINSKEPFHEVNIPTNFFTGMRKLRVVDLTRMQLFSLPSSIAFLINLQTLCLDQSRLGDIGIIGNLKNLEVLSLLKSDILKLPKELGQLTKLRLLDLTDCFRLKVIAPNVISSLTRLEELYMYNCSVEWEVDGPNGERSNASLAELMQLSRLTTLEIYVENDDNLPEGFFERRLNRFKISIGDASFFVAPEADIVERIETSRMLKLKLNSTNIFSKKLQGIKNVEYLCLDKLQGVNNVLFELDTEGFSQLKHLQIQNNPNFKCIVELIGRVPCEPFPLLELLILDNLIQLEKICHDQLRVLAFKKLRAVIVKQCHALSNIFCLSAAKCLPRLQKIAVIDCRNMKGLFDIGGENDEIEKIEFPQLNTLCLQNLPELISFCSGVKAPNRQGLHEELTEITCSNEISLEDNLNTSTTLFNHKVLLPNMESLEMCEINVEKIWHNQLPVMFPHFQRLTRLTLTRCHKLKNIFSASMVQSFEQLQCLDIGDCVCLREIISKEGADQVTPNFCFPQLTSLFLRNLPELRCLYPGKHTFECPALKYLTVDNIFASESFGFDGSNERDQPEIPDQQPLFLFKKVVLPNLEISTLCEINVEKIWHNQRPVMFPHFQRLTQLTLHYCHKLKYIFSASMVQSFEKLQCLEIRDCMGVQEIISKEGADQVAPNFFFPQLMTLILKNLPELICLYPGMHTLECPALKYLEVRLGKRVEIFNSESFSFRGSNEKDQPETSAQQPLFTYEKMFPNLEQLEVDGEGMRTILKEDFPHHLFDHLEHFHVVKDDSVFGFSLNLLERFHNLEELILSHCSYKERVSNGGALDKHVGKIARIKRLRLYNLDDLEQLWKPDSGLDSIFQYLETLDVQYCPNLSILLPPSSVSFRNITKLEAFFCKGLKNLVTSSTAKGLVGLVEMKLYGCSAMTEVIESEGNEAAKEEIIFSKLKQLTLFYLESLTSFCSSNYILKFPSLEILHVIRCPKMSIFTTSELSTPQRVDVWCDWGEKQFSHWDGDLNTTIQNLHKSKLLEWP